MKNRHLRKKKKKKLCILISFKRFNITRVWHSQQACGEFYWALKLKWDKKEKKKKQRTRSRILSSTRFKKKKNDEVCALGIGMRKQQKRHETEEMCGAHFHSFFAHLFFSHPNEVAYTYLAIV